MPAEACSSRPLPTPGGAGLHDGTHWIDANIHSTEVTSGVAALYLIQYLVVGYDGGIDVVVEALRTRTFYVVPRVNPDGL